MFANDTQLFNKNDVSVKKSFDILTIYEKASGSKVNYEKTKGMYIGLAKNNRPKFTKIVWTKDNVKTLGIHHGYNIQNVHVWKNRNLTYTGQTLIVNNLLISLCGYEIEMRGIPEKYVKEITTLVWGFIWGGGINQIDRKVCCLGVENEGMGMNNIQ